jgi:hypothetical protein
MPIMMRMSSARVLNIIEYRSDRISSIVCHILLASMDKTNTKIIAVFCSVKALSETFCSYDRVCYSRLKD